MADYNRDRDYSHYAADDNWDKFDDRYGTEGSYRQNRGDYSRVRYIPDNDENRWEQSRYDRYSDEPGRRYGGGFDDWRGQGNVNYGGGYQNQYAQGNYDSGRPRERREDWGYGYANTGMNDDYNRSYYGTQRSGMDEDREYRQAMERRREYDRRNWENRSREGYREDDRNLWERTRDRISSRFSNEDEERRRLEGPYRGKGPKGYTRSVERIREDVCERLADDDKLDASNIDVRMEGNDVVLEGTVETKRDKRRAEDLVDSIPGVTNVQNHLVVGIATTRAVIDAVQERDTENRRNIPNR